MARTAKIWTALGVAIIAGGSVAQAGAPMPFAPIKNLNFVLVDSEGGEGGEGGQGGEGGGDGAPATYAMGSTDANAFKYDGKPQIKAYAELVHASYAAAHADAAKLQAAIEAMLAAPSEETLIAARKAWLAARPAYLHTEAFRFYDGPIEATEGEINSWPMNEAYIDYVEGKADAGLINSKNPLDIASLTAINQKSDEADVTTGWHAIEFLLWGQDLSASGAGNRPFTDYVAGKPATERRRAYLAAVTTKLVADFGQLEQAWAPSVSGNYRDKFEELEQREALGRIVNGMAILAGYELMSERIGVALDSGDQEDEQSCFSDNTKQDFAQDLEGIKRVWNDAQLAELVTARDPELAKHVSALLQDSETRISKLGNPWDQVLAAPKDSPARNDAEAVVASLQALADGLKAVGNKLGVLVLIPSD